MGWVKCNRDEKCQRVLVSLGLGVTGLAHYCDNGGDLVR
jgi:hypothetical protein